MQFLASSTNQKRSKYNRPPRPKGAIACLIPLSDNLPSTNSLWGTPPPIGVAARVLGAEQFYPPVTLDFEQKFNKESAAHLELLAKPGGSQVIQERGAVLGRAVTEARSGTLSSTTLKNPIFAQLLPYNVQGIAQAVGSDAFLRDLVLQYRTYAVLGFVQQLQVQTDAKTLSEIAKTLGRLTDDVEWVTGDILGIKAEQPEQGNEGLADVVKQLSKEQAAQRIQGDLPNTLQMEEDFASLCAGFLCPLHYLSEFQALCRLPGSVVWSRASLYHMFASTQMRVEIAPILAEVIVRYTKENDPFQMGDPLIRELYIIGRKVLHDYYRQFPPQVPLAQVLGLVTSPGPQATKTTAAPAPSSTAPSAVTLETAGTAAPREDASWQALEQPVETADNVGAPATDTPPPAGSQSVPITTQPPKRKISGLDAQ